MKNLIILSFITVFISNNMIYCSEESHNSEFRDYCRIQGNINNLKFYIHYAISSNSQELSKLPLDIANIIAEYARKRDISELSPDLLYKIKESLINLMMNFTPLTEAEKKYIEFVVKEYFNIDFNLNEMLSELIPLIKKRIQISWSWRSLGVSDSAIDLSFLSSNEYKKVEQEVNTIKKQLQGIIDLINKELKLRGYFREILD